MKSFVIGLGVLTLLNTDEILPGTLCPALDSSGSEAWYIGETSSTVPKMKKYLEYLLFNWKPDRIGTVQPEDEKNQRGILLMCINIWKVWNQIIFCGV